MSLILNIDTAINNGAVGLSQNGLIVAQRSSTDQKEHASFLQPAIQQIMLEAGKNLTEIDAVSVTIGPGSYTGLRVGLSSAKGMCYALQKPLIAINTLEVMALAAIEATIELLPNVSSKDCLFCPMIDARRMEVFAALYTSSLETVQAPMAMVLDENSFFSHIKKFTTFFSGNGMPKFRNIIKDENAVFLEAQHGISHLAKLAEKAYDNDVFADIAYLEPFYAKAFYSTQIIKN